MKLSTEQIRRINQELDTRDYDSAHEYLAAVYELLKGSDEDFSYAHLSIALGFGSVNVHAMINQKRPITSKAAEKIAAQIRLSKKQATYLIAMAVQSRATSSTVREDAFHKQLKQKGQTLRTAAEKRQLKFFEHWYHAAILEVLRLPDASDDPQWLAEHIQPRVTVPKVKSAIKLLKDLGYIVFSQKASRHVPSEKTISTGNEVERLAIISFHRQMIDLAVTAMDQISAEERDIGAITVAVTDEQFEQMMQEIIALRKRFLKQAEDSRKPTRIVQLNMQLFPLNKPRGLK